METCGEEGVIWVVLVERTSVVEMKRGVEEEEVGRWS